MTRTDQLRTQIMTRLLVALGGENSYGGMIEEGGGVNLAGLNRIELTSFWIEPDGTRWEYTVATQVTMDFSPAPRAVRP